MLANALALSLCIYKMLQIKGDGWTNWFARIALQEVKEINENKYQTRNLHTLKNWYMHHEMEIIHCWSDREREEKKMKL